ncbi:hypothetical protein [Lactococcus petauri]|uniref:hypothetical protein n=1 Tax=Lactococcus petauri TaxID=1940789 RepID=UPI0022E1469A|nr:hypothetical protein [Lactococcus petauri]
MEHVENARNIMLYLRALQGKAARIPERRKYVVNNFDLSNRSVERFFFLFCFIAKVETINFML